MFKKLFGSSKNPTEKFWEWFAANAYKFSDTRKIKNDDLHQFRRQLNKVHKGLTFEIGLPKGTPELYISADGDRKLFGTVREFVKAAPDVLGWKIVAFRQPTPRPEDFAIQANGREFKGGGIWVVPIPEGAMFHLVVYSPGFQQDDSLHGNALFIILDTTLGEEAMETRIGVIDFLPLESQEQPDPNAIRLNALQQIVLRLN